MGEDVVLSIHIPTGETVFEFGRAVKVDFWGALNSPVSENAVAAETGAACCEDDTGDAC